jgi:putative flippase GtrA
VTVIEKLLELTRFGTVTVLGLIVDLAVAWTLAVIFLAPLPLAAAVGFGCGALLNYLLHGMWTFRAGPGASAPRRVVLYVIVTTLVLAVRILGVAILVSVTADPKGYELPILAAATVASFSVNYFLSKYVVFRATHNPARLRSMHVE